MTQLADRLASRAALRLAKAGLVGGVALYFTLIALNNVLDYRINLAFVEHVLRMDTTLPASRLEWRALTSPVVHLGAYAGIVVWEAVAAILLWTGAVSLVRAALGAGPYEPARRLASVALVVGLLLWLVAFVTLGGEWFLMWQSRTWNGLDASGRNFAIQALVLLVLASPEPTT